MFKRILLMADQRTRWQSALERAAALARRHQAELVVVDVLENLPGHVEKLLRGQSLAAVQAAAIARRREQLERATAPLQQAGICRAVRVLTGKPFLEVIREVLREKHDLVMKAAEGKGGARTRLFGSTDMHLLRVCPVPVWIIKPGQPPNYARIVAAVDPDPTDDRRDSLNAQILCLAGELTRAEQSELHVVHAWTMQRWGGLGISRAEQHALAQQEQSWHEERIAALLKRWIPDDLQPQAHLLLGDARERVPALVRELRADLLVMGTVGRTEIPGFFIGNTAEDILNEVRSDVLTVKPRGFATPVRLAD